MHACRNWDDVGGSQLPNDIMRRLLDKGVPIDAETENGDTPLSLAISAGGVGSVGFLVKAGAALDLADKEGRNCLDLAAVMFSLFPKKVREKGVGVHPVI
ncbi:conserved unknown protein [Ectocarpus siliculosus]|uniref:Uncharacterized protein n=1 Tax=Ectocarpus siliculosus TaxID=2880 RepID=D8LLS5_ECTSI|nr:conserved unknown protein [Ectocarpus siliculosus]|eukprot:CBN76161.1 conserved unknown protein [Ectocarpus siliculosus]